MKIIKLAFTLFLLLIASQAYSRDTKHMLSINEALQSADFKAKLDPTITLYFGHKKMGRVIRSFGQFATNKKTNAFAKSDEKACRWAFLSALIALQSNAKKRGGNAVIGIASYYKKHTVVNNSQYECHAGAIMAGVALTGKVVRLSRHK